MKALVVYDSKFGNTEHLARVIAESLIPGQQVRVVPAASVQSPDLEGLDLLVVGGPTQGHGLSPALRTFLDDVPASVLVGRSVAAFDTRLTWPKVLAGSAAASAAKRLTKRGAELVVEPESFLVKSSEGPLVEGEVERAVVWAAGLRNRMEAMRKEPAVVAGAPLD